MDFYFTLYQKEVNKHEVKISADDYFEALQRARSGDYDERIDTEWDVDMPEPEEVMASATSNPLMWSRDCKCEDIKRIREMTLTAAADSDRVVESDEAYFPSLYPCAVYYHDKSMFLKNSDMMVTAANHFNVNYGLLTRFLSAIKRRELGIATRTELILLKETQFIYQSLKSNCLASNPQNEDKEQHNA